MTESYLRVTKSDNITIVHLPEKLISTGIVAGFRDAWLQLTEKEHRNILVDFDNVRRFGSEATGILVRAAQRVRTKGGDMKLCSMSDDIKEIFTICRLIPAMFELHQSAASGLDAFKDARAET